MIAHDEVHSLNLLDEHDIILKKYIKEQNGSIIKHIGDAIFAEFPSRENAIKASCDIQQHLKKRNNNYNKKDKILIRIGLHTGTVVEKDNDLFGNDVNLCARIEGCAIPEGIACSSEMIDGLDIKYKRSYGFVRLKNIPNPQTLYRIYFNNDDYTSDSQEELLEMLRNKGLNLVDSDNISIAYKTLSILYPDNLGDKEHEFLCYEFLKQIISDSNKIEDIRTSSINDIMQFKDENDISLISRKLASEYIVKMRMHCADTTINIDVEVTSINELSVIYSNSFKGKINEIKQISGKILLEMSLALNLEIDDKLKELFQQKIEIDNDAYKLFLEGKSLATQTSGASDLKKSKDILEEAIDKDDNFPEAYAVLGMTNKLLGDFDEAEEMLDEALDLMDDIEDYEVLTLINNYFGIYYRDLGNPKKSIKFFEKALTNQKKIGDNVSQANIYNNMSQSYGLMADNDQMINYIKRAQSIYDEYDETISLASSYGMEANYYANIQDHNNAIKVFDKAKRIFYNEGLYFKYTQCLILQSQCYIVIENLLKAKDNLDEAKSYSEDFNNPMMNGKIYFNLAMMNIKKEEEEKALENIDDAIDIFNDLNNKSMLSQLYIMRGNIYIDIDKIKKAEKALDKARKYSKRLKSMTLQNKIDKLSQRIEND